MAYIGPEPIIVQDGGTGKQTLTAHGVVLGQGTSPVNVTSTGNSGQVLTSNGALADPTFQTLTAPSITWSDTSGGYTAVKNNGYFITATSTATLPNTPTIGDTIVFDVDTTQILTIQTSGTQILRLGNTVSAAGGTAVSTARGDSMTLVYRQTNTCWEAISSVGNWTIT